MSDSQKFIARNRAPRVQIEYDVELYGAEKKVQLPFVMGVMSDLAGKSEVEQPPVADRKFLEIDVDNFDERMKSMAPRVAFTVPNTLTGEGNLAVDLTFESMDDFTPGAIAARIAPLRPLLQARSQLSTLMAYMDGKSGAEALISNLLADPTLLQALTGPAAASSDTDAALARLKALMPEDLSEVGDNADDVLDALSAAAPADTDGKDDSTEVLAGLAAQAPEDVAEDDGSADVLSGLAAQAPEDVAEDDGSADVLSGLAAQAPEDVAEDDGSADVLSGLAAQAPEDVTADDGSADVLSGLAARAPEDVAEDVDSADVLADVAAQAPEDVPGEDGSADVLAGLAAQAPEDVTAEDGSADVLSGLAAYAPEDVAEDDGSADALSDLAAQAPEDAAEDDGSADVLSGLAAQAPEDVAADDGLDDVLGGLAEAAPSGEAAEDGLDDVLGGLAAAAPSGEAAEDGLDDVLGGLVEAAPSGEAADDGLDDVLGGLAEAAPTGEAVQASDPLDDLLGASEGDPLDDLLGDASEGEDALDDLLAGGTNETDPLDDLLESGETDALDDLLAEGETDPLDDLLADAPDESAAADPLDELLEPGETDALDDLLAGAEDDTPTDAGGAALTGEPAFAFGALNADRPAAERLERKRFRIALFGDFSGRAARGLLETGDALAAREPVMLDPDTVEDIIGRFAKTLVLPLGKEGAGVEVPLKGLDDLHPDELVENVEVFAELSGLKGQLQAGSTAAGAAERLKGWGDEHGIAIAPPRLRSSATSVPADLRLSDFQRLIGDHEAVLAQAGPVEDLIARIVGPHVRQAPDADAVALAGAVDAAISSAMRLILHHPDFQALESQWRSLDLLARSIEADDSLDVMLYDISAEEIAADLASATDLAQSGLARLLTEAPMDPETGRGGYSALIGLYTFEETPPHAELLGRVGRVAAHVDAAFFAALTPAFLDTAKEDRHPLVAEAWDTLRAMPEAAYLGLASPRFLLRRPYGAKTEPIYGFEFEEFSMAEGLRGMLWANPVVLIAILIAQSFRKNGPALDLGSVMSLGDIPFHVISDRYGDQVALPCTERNLTLEKVEHAMARGLMPVVWIKGRDEIRLASFQSLGGETIRGPWSDLPPPRPSPPVPKAPEPVGEPESAQTDDLGDLDDLLAEFSADAGDTPPADSGSGDIDAELAALLEDL